ncbi:hypothetical protein HDV06_006837 [Boothiomyces sp. JEL0866]|nr:hypothetical protein HDV06_006837 [Boothiomyces sp. JEL0866]
MSNLQGVLLRNLNWWTSDQDILTVLTDSLLIDELIPGEFGFAETKLNGKSTGKCFLLFKDEASATKAKNALETKLSEPEFAIKDLKIDLTPSNVTVNPFVQTEEKTDERGRKRDSSRDRKDSEYRRNASKEKQGDSREGSQVRRKYRNESPRKRRSRNDSISPIRKSKRDSISPRRSRRDSISPPRKSRNSRNYSPSPKRRSRKSPSPRRSRNERYRDDSRERRRDTSVERRKRRKREVTPESNKDKELKRSGSSEDKGRTPTPEKTDKPQKIDTTNTSFDDDDFVLPSPEERKPHNF